MKISNTITVSTIDLEAFPSPYLWIKAKGVSCLVHKDLLINAIESGYFLKTETNDNTDRKPS